MKLRKFLTIVLLTGLLCTSTQAAHAQFGEGTSWFNQILGANAFNRISNVIFNTGRSVVNTCRRNPGKVVALVATAVAVVDACYTSGTGTVAGILSENLTVLAGTVAATFPFLAAPAYLKCGKRGRRILSSGIIACLYIPQVVATSAAGRYLSIDEFLSQPEYQQQRNAEMVRIKSFVENPDGNVEIIPPDYIYAEDYVYSLYGYRINRQGNANHLIISDDSDAFHGQFVIKEYDYVNVTSTDLMVDEEFSRGIPNLHQIKMDNRLPFIDFGIKFDAITMKRGLCHHMPDFYTLSGDPIGCAGIPLTVKGISTLLAQVSPRLKNYGYFALHGAANDERSFISRLLGSMDLPLSEVIVSNIYDGTNYFNAIQEAVKADIKYDNTGLVIYGQLRREFNSTERKRMKQLVGSFFLVDDIRPQPDIGSQSWLDWFASWFTGRGRNEL